MAGNDSNGNTNSASGPQCDPLQIPALVGTSTPDVPCIMPLLSIPDAGKCNTGASIFLTGTARNGGTVPSLGAVDIGVSKSAYYFRVALPGVKKDPGEFSCEIERNGKVQIKGVTSTGERAVSRHSRVYEMKFQQQCPPGPFTLSFHLTGPVDPRLFSPKFRSDGVLEAIVMKYQ